MPALPCRLFRLAVEAVAQIHRMEVLRVVREPLPFGRFSG